MADIQYDPACMDCRHDAVKDPDGTTWQCNGHIRAERDWLRTKLANVMVEWEHDVEVLTKERNAALTLAEQRGVAYDMTWREVESLRELNPDIEVSVLEAAALIPMHPVALDAAIRRDDIPVRWQGNRRFLRVADLREWRDGAAARRAARRLRRSA